MTKWQFQTLAIYLIISVLQNSGGGAPPPVKVRLFCFVVFLDFSGLCAGVTR